MSAAWQIIEGDALEVMRTFEPATFDAIVTDPPYATTNDAGSVVDSKVHVPLPRETQFFEAWLREIVAEWARVLKPTGAAWLTIDWRGAMCLDSAARRLGMLPVEVGVWGKGGLGQGYTLRKTYECFAVVRMRGFKRLHGDVPDLWRVPWPAGKKEHHAAEKPVGLLERALDLVSAPGAVILDPFSGSGTTGVAAMQTRRRFVGIEREPYFCDVARARVAAACSQTALFADGG